MIPMAAIAQELNLPAFMVSIMHLARVLTIRIMVPIIVILLR
jgi:uncharacterized membrane protein AbrB (regulator of aidB expression)